MRTRIVGALYATQQSVIDEIIEDQVPLPVVVLHQELPHYGQTAVSAVADADAAVRALGHLAGNLARAVGSEPGPATSSARDLGFAELDGPYRRWLSRLGNTTDPHQSRRDWQVVVDRTIRRLGRRLLDGAGPAASEGRYVEIREEEKRWIDDAQADLWFRRAVKAALPLVPPPGNGQPPEEPEGGSDPDRPDDTGA